ncbi:hypothetical protein FA95DRAFT_1128609 [Auriscalpium vulgare]|uniref:Uncharacterized protein n=1 Tax=Auriscalpium vulgare TaxID=40419 RepID=A0ACB8R4Y3_9AGAM|nr:hypothetical protein FA95DRAFT_1128609 [Auriscalpium vulgare]
MTSSTQNVGASADSSVSLFWPRYTPQLLTFLDGNGAAEHLVRHMSCAEGIGALMRALAHPWWHQVCRQDYFLLSLNYLRSALGLPVLRVGK